MESNAKTNRSGQNESGVVERAINIHLMGSQILLAVALDL
jgi:hypothetical protein